MPKAFLIDGPYNWPLENRLILNPSNHIQIQPFKDTYRTFIFLPRVSCSLTQNLWGLRPCNRFDIEPECANAYFIWSNRDQQALSDYAASQPAYDV